MSEEQKISLEVNVQMEWLLVCTIAILCTIFVRGCDGQPSNYEHFLKAAYNYEMKDFSK